MHKSFTENGFVQGIRISDNRGKMYDNIVEQLQYHYLKVFDVPFDEVSTSFIFFYFFGYFKNKDNYTGNGMEI